MSGKTLIHTVVLVVLLVVDGFTVYEFVKAKRFQEVKMAAAVHSGETGKWHIEDMYIDTEDSLMFSVFPNGRTTCHSGLEMKHHPPERLE